MTTIWQMHLERMIAMVNENAFVDTTAFYALMDRSDGHHEEAAALWVYFLDHDFRLLTSNYVVVETLALLQTRLGFDAANLWCRDVLGVVEVTWVDGPEHDLALELWRGLGRKKVSFVDCVSFVTMRHGEVEKAFCFDKHFAEQGFETRFDSMMEEEDPNPPSGFRFAQDNGTLRSNPGHQKGIRCKAPRSDD